MRFVLQVARGSFCLSKTQDGYKGGKFQQSKVEVENGPGREPIDSTKPLTNDDSIPGCPSSWLDRWSKVSVPLPWDLPHWMDGLLDYRLPVRRRRSFS